MYFKISTETKFKLQEHCLKRNSVCHCFSSKFTAEFLLQNPCVGLSVVPYLTQAQLETSFQFSIRKIEESLVCN